MKRYPRNSPQAIARVLAMMMVTDGKLDPREIEVLEQLNIYEIVGISRVGFMGVVHDYCSDLLASGNAEGRIRLVDKARIDEVVGLVDDRRSRVLVCGMLLNIVNADDRISDTELAVLRYILDSWCLPLDALERELAAPAREERAVA
ncbi:MAG TPA: hypothetical protein VF859_13965 [Burkholderiales bacterium]